MRSEGTRLSATMSLNADVTQWNNAKQRPLTTFTYTFVCFMVQVDYPNILAVRAIGGKFFASIFAVL